MLCDEFGLVHVKVMNAIVVDVLDVLNETFWPLLNGMHWDTDC